MLNGLSLLMIVKKLMSICLPSIPFSMKRGVSLSIKRGEFVVIFGLSGGGKTTLLNIMGTIDKPTKGDMRLCGTHIDSHTSDSVFSQIRLHEIGFVFQAFNLLGSMTALENVEMPMILAGKLSREQRRARAVSLLERVGMGERLNHVPSQLSGGEQQRVTIARAIANSPSLLLLDEPTGDLDSRNTAVVMNLLTELNQKQKITLVMVTHDVAMRGFADRVVWMRDGKIVRVEQISQETRDLRFSQLREDLAKYGPVAATHAHRPKRQNRNTTFWRQPTDYETHPEHIPNPETPVEFTEMTVDEYERQTNLIRSRPATKESRIAMPSYSAPSTPSTDTTNDDNQVELDILS
jgi:putative ABC transport system ATP-binding protein